MKWESLIKSIKIINYDKMIIENVQSKKVIPKFNATLLRRGHTVWDDVSYGNWNGNAQIFAFKGLKIISGMHSCSKSSIELNITTFVPVVSLKA